MDKHEKMNCEELKALALQFRQALSELGLVAIAGTELDRLISEVEELPSLRARIASLPRSHDIRPLWRNILAVRRFALKFVRLYQRPEFDVFANHLKLLNKGGFAENRPDRSDQANKMFELLIALLAFEVGTDLVIDDPIHSGGKPGEKKVDVQISFAGERWGIECKVPAGGLESVLNRFDGGVEQIEAIPGLTVGAIAVSARNVINHDEFWLRFDDGDYFTYVSKDMACDRMKMAATIIEGELRKIRSPEIWEANLVGKKTKPLMLGFFQSACVVIEEGRQAVTDVALLMAMKFGESPEPCPELFNALNSVLHDRPDLIG